MQYVHTREYHLAVERKEIPTMLCSWVNLEDINGSQRLQGTHCVRVLEQLKAEKQKVGGWWPGWGKEEMGSCCLVGAEFCFAR